MISTRLILHCHCENTIDRVYFLCLTVVAENANYNRMNRKHGLLILTEMSSTSIAINWNKDK